MLKHGLDHPSASDLGSSGLELSDPTVHLFRIRFCVHHFSRFSRIFTFFLRSFGSHCCSGISSSLTSLLQGKVHCVGRKPPCLRPFWALGVSYPRRPAAFQQFGHPCHWTHQLALAHVIAVLGTWSFRIPGARCISAVVFLWPSRHMVWPWHLVIVVFGHLKVTLQAPVAFPQLCSAHVSSSISLKEATHSSTLCC